MSGLPAIPVVDIREGGTLQHAREGAARARALRDTCLAWLPRAAGPLVPLFDRLARRWLLRSRSPYVAEVAAIAANLGFPGVWFLNASYQWGCTALAREENGAPWLARTLDWPLPGLGRHVEVARMQGPAGDFLNVTWPGYVGTLTALAPGRFGAGMNQAPLRRRTRHPRLRLYDLTADLVHTLAFVRHMPPDQLLRQVFETCGSFEEARHMLEMMPVARPVIYTLAGTAAGECCVIERTETGHATRFNDTAAANDWLRSAEPWEARIGGDRLLTCSFAEAAENSRLRREALHGFPGALGRDDFPWIVAPVLNPYTRIGIAMCPATGTLRVRGYELAPGSELPQPATLPCAIEALTAA